MKFYAIALRTKLKNPHVVVPDKVVTVSAKKTEKGTKYFARAPYMYKGKKYTLYKIVSKKDYAKLKK